MKTVRVVAAVIRDNNRIFATQRGYGDLKGGWEFPGGKIGDLVLKEHEAAKWLNKNTIDEVEWLPADVTLIDVIKEKI